MSEPSTFAAETQRPSQAWLTQVVRALRDPHGPLPEAFSFRQERDGWLFLSDLVAWTDRLEAALQSGTPSFEHLVTVLKTGLRAFQGLQRQDANWMDAPVERGGSLMGMWLSGYASARQVEDQRVEGQVSAQVFLALGELRVWPTSRPDQAHAGTYWPDEGPALGSWMHRVLDLAHQASLPGWGQAQTEPRLLGWWMAVDRVAQQVTEDGGALPLWQAHVRHLVLSMVAGHAHRPEARALAERWGLGWPKALGGQGMIEVQDAPLRLPAPPPSTVRNRRWIGALESLHEQALIHELGHTVPERRPAWAMFLMEGWAARKGLSATLFVDALGDQGWARWADAQRQAYEKTAKATMPAMPEAPTGPGSKTAAAQQSYRQQFSAWSEACKEVERQRLLACRAQADHWRTAIRLWDLQDRPAAPTPSRSRHRI